MDYPDPLLPGTLLRRYRRFLADILLADGRQITAHTPNTGSMRGCCTPGAPVWVRDTADPARKYRYAWELIEVRPGVPVGINTNLANRLVEEALVAGRIPELAGYRTIHRERRYGAGSRIDLLLDDGPGVPCHVEVKNVTLVEDGVALFPDAVTTRGLKHLRELTEVVRGGGRAAMVYCIQRRDAHRFRPADAIDPAYGAALRAAVAGGVEALACTCAVSPRGVELQDRVPLWLD